MTTFRVELTSIEQKGPLPVDADKKQAPLAAQLQNIVEPLFKLCNSEKAKITAADLSIVDGLNRSVGLYYPSTGKAEYKIFTAFAPGDKEPSGFSIVSFPMRADKHRTFVYNKNEGTSVNLNKISEILFMCASKNGAAPALFYEMATKLNTEYLYLEVAGGRQGKKQKSTLKYGTAGLEKLPPVTKERKKLADTYHNKYGFNEVALLYSGSQSKALQAQQNLIDPDAKGGYVPQKAYFSANIDGVPYSMMARQTTVLDKLAKAGFKAVPPPATGPVTVPVALPDPVDVGGVKVPAKVASPAKAPSPKVEVPIVADVSKVPVRPKSPPPPPRPVVLAPPMLPAVQVPVVQQVLKEQAEMKRAAEEAKVAASEAKLQRVIKRRAKRAKAAKKSQPAAAAASSSSSSSAAKSEKGKKRKRRETFSTYIYKVLKQVHPDTGLSNRGMAVMNSLVVDLMERLASEAALLRRFQKHNTLQKRDIQTAVRLLLSGELAKHAVSEGTKAVTNFESSKS